MAIITETIKNIRSRISLAIVIVLLFTFLIQILSYSFAWVTYNYWYDDVSNSGMVNESYIEYSVYSIQIHFPDFNSVFIFQSGNSDAAKAHNDLVIKSFKSLEKKLRSIEGYVLSFRNLGSGIILDNADAYAISSDAEHGYDSSYYLDLDKKMADGYSKYGFTPEQISQFCSYHVAQMDIRAILMEGFRYSEGGFTEDNLKYDYMFTDDGEMPTIPIVMGWDFRNYYEIGDIFYSDGSLIQAALIKKGEANPSVIDQDMARYIVVGFLDNDTAVEYRPGLRMNVDNYIIIPHVPPIPQYFPTVSDKTLALDFYGNLRSASTLIYIDKQQEQQTVEALTKALAEDPIMGIYAVLEKNEQVNAMYKQMYHKRMINYAIIAGSTLVFCVAVIIIIVVNKFKNGKKDVAIHRLVGATSGDVVRTYVLEFAIYLLCADILSHYVYIIYAFNPGSIALVGFWMTLPVNGVEIRMIYPLMLAMNVVFLAIVALIAHICSSKLDTAEIIKGKE
jgi:hypothetical protein